MQLFLEVSSMRLQIVVVHEKCLFVCLLVFTRTMRQPRFYFYHDLNIQDK